MQSKQFDVVVVGELNPDLILAGDVIPEFGQVEKLVQQATLTIGSSSAIFACGVARLGLRVAFLGKVGRRPYREGTGRIDPPPFIDTAYDPHRNRFNKEK